jgi:hypothetical protein
MYSSYKLVVSGRFAELYRFERPVKLGDKHYPKIKRVVSSDYLVSAGDSVYRSSRNLRRLIEANSFCWDCMPLFVTLTFANTVTDLTVANRQFTNFIKRLNFSFFNDKSIKIQYVAVPEFQKDKDFTGSQKLKGGSVHYHIIFFNVPFIPRIYDRFLEIWRVSGLGGTCRVVSVRDSRGIGVYISKYFSKSFSDMRFFNRKRYFSSRKLKRSVIFYDEIKIAEIIGDSKPVYMRWLGDFDFVGMVQYWKFNISPVVDNLLIDKEKKGCKFNESLAARSRCQLSLFR